MTQSHAPSVKKSKSSTISAATVFSTLAKHGYIKLKAEKVSTQTSVQRDDGSYGLKTVAFYPTPKKAFKRNTKATRARHGDTGHPGQEDPVVRTSKSGKSVHMQSADGEIQLFVPAKGMLTERALDEIQKLTKITFTNN